MAKHHKNKLHSFPIKLLERLEAHAKHLEDNDRYARRVSRSGLICLAISEYLDREEKGAE